MLTTETSVVTESLARQRTAARLQHLAQQFRVTVLDILHEKGTGHWGGAASAAELLVALYFDAMNIRPGQPSWPDRDRLVLSKGHARRACSTPFWRTAACRGTRA
jgi:transketolase N-terminal domain/subunit